MHLSSWIGLTALIFALTGCQKTDSQNTSSSASTVAAKKEIKSFLYSLQKEGALECLHQAQLKWPERMLYSIEESYSMNEKDSEPKRGQLMGCTLIYQNPKSPSEVSMVKLDPYTGEFGNPRAVTPSIPSNSPAGFQWQKNLIALKKINTSAIKLKVDSEFKDAGLQYEDLGLAMLTVHGYGGNQQGLVELDFTGHLKANLVKKDRIIYMSADGLHSKIKP